MRPARSRARFKIRARGRRQAPPLHRQERVGYGASRRVAGAPHLRLPGLSRGRRFIVVTDGREFQATDTAASPRVAIVNELFARKYFPNGSAIGKRLRMDGPGGPLTEIVGVAAPSKYVFVVEPPFEFLYLPLSQNPADAM